MSPPAARAAPAPFLSPLPTKAEGRFPGDPIWEFIKFNILSAALLACKQALFISTGVPEGLAPTLANIVNILMQVVISCPAMKFWVMPDKK